MVNCLVTVAHTYIVYQNVIYHFIAVVVNVAKNMAFMFIKIEKQINIITLVRYVCLK